MMPNNALSTTPLPAVFLPPRTNFRYTASAGLIDSHYGGIAVGDATHGISYQLWTAYCQNNNIYLEAPNTPAYALLSGVNAVWVGLAFDQSSRVFVTYADINGNASYYWYNTLTNSYTTSGLSGVVKRPFCALDDSRPQLSSSADVLLIYVRGGVLYSRQQRDRYGVEYTLGSAPGTLVQIGMNHADRFQFAFQSGNTAGGTLPPVEWNLALGINEPA